MSGNQNTTYRRPSVSIGMGFDGADYSWMSKDQGKDATGFVLEFRPRQCVDKLDRLSPGRRRQSHTRDRVQRRTPPVCGRCPDAGDASE